MAKYGASSIKLIKYTDKEIKTIDEALEYARHNELVEASKKLDEKVATELGFMTYLPYMPKDIYEEALQLQELVAMGFCTESELKKLHDEYKHGYGEIFSFAKNGYSYKQIKEIFDKEAFNQFKNDVLFPKYKIYGGNITGSVKNPEFHLKIKKAICLTGEDKNGETL